MDTSISVRLTGRPRVECHAYADQPPLLVVRGDGTEVVFSVRHADPDEAVEIVDELADAFTRFAAATREHAARQVAEDRASEAVAHFTERVSA
ncbi:MAG TPA: hypothetical protein VFJ19_09220 [Nocardioidaceae bacterium]|nr:hypothetical protein [Nocardioidaceae bacterium]